MSAAQDRHAADPAAPQAYAVETAGLTIDFGGLRAVDGVTMQAGVGDRVAIIGPNGAGKTSLFNLVAGQLRPTAGTVRIFGREATALPAPVRARLGLARTFQLTNLLGALTVAENVRLAVAAAQPRARVTFWRPLERIPEVAAAADDLLRTWELWPVRDRTAAELGHGRQRVLEIVLALATGPRLLLLDEPTAGLARREAALLTDFAAALPPDLTILLIEHDMDVAFAIADVVQVMADGAMLATGPPEVVKRDPAVVAAYLGGDAHGSGPGHDGGG